MVENMSEQSNPDLKKKARELFNCESSPLSYLVKSNVSFGSNIKKESVKQKN